MSTMSLKSLPHMSVGLSQVTSHQLPNSDRIIDIEQVDRAQEGVREG